MTGVLNLTQPSHLLAKLEHELSKLLADRSDSYAATNAIRDAYHLREWIWHDRLKNVPALLSRIIGAAGDEHAWNAWINTQFPDFKLLKELCNGSKHFDPQSNTLQLDIHRGGFDSPAAFFDNPHSGWDDNGFHVQIDGGRIVAMVDLLPRAHDFWVKLLTQFPELA